MLRDATLGESHDGIFLADSSAFKDSAALFTLPNDPHVCIPVNYSPFCMFQIMHISCEDGRKRIDQGVRWRRQFHGRDVGRRLRQENGVAGQSTFLQCGIAACSKAHLLHATPTDRSEHLGG